MNRESERKRLVELIGSADDECKHTHSCKKCSGYGKGSLCMNYHIADFLLDNDIIVPRNKPIGVMKDDNPYNADVYCPYCGTNLSGYYGEEPTRIIQCYGCGEYLDNTKAITREDALKALGGDGE